MASAPGCSLVFLVDVDNTLIDNDTLRGGLTAAVETVIGAAATTRFWEIYEDVRRDLDHVHFATILARLRSAFPGIDAHGELEAALTGFAFADYRFADSLAVLARLRSFGPVAITSDGDDLYQVAKVRGAGIEAAVDRCWIVPHKEQYWPEIEAALPADRYVVIDDKPSILEAARAYFGERGVTVWMRHGKYAGQKGRGTRNEERRDAGVGLPGDERWSGGFDLEIESIGALLTVPRERYCG